MSKPSSSFSQKSENEDKALRPDDFASYAGQTETKQLLQIYLQAAKQRQETLDHTLLYGPPGLGKTTLALIIAKAMGTPCKLASGPSIEKVSDLVSLLAALPPQGILFIDEIHRLPKVVEEVLYSAMEDFVIDVIIGEGPNTRAVRMELEPFTLIGATTRFGSLSAPLRERFGITRRLNYYSLTELSQVIKRTGDFYHLQISPETVTLLASCARGTPRLANRFLRRLRDFCEVAQITTLEYDFAKEALLKLGVNLHGLDETDLCYLEVLIQRFHGGPAGVKNLATTLREEQETITEVIEPYLIQEQYLLRTKQGRVALPKAYIQFGLLPPTVE